MIETPPVRRPHVFPKGPFRDLSSRAGLAATGLVGLWIRLGPLRSDPVSGRISAAPPKHRAHRTVDKHRYQGGERT